MGGFGAAWGLLEVWCKGGKLPLLTRTSGAGTHDTGGAPGPDPLRRLPPPPPLPPSLEIGWKVPHHGRRRRPKEILLDLVEGEKMGFRPMCLYSKCSVF